MNNSILSSDPKIKKLIEKIDKLVCPVCGVKGWEFSVYNLKPAYGIYCSGWCLMNSLKKDNKIS